MPRVTVTTVQPLSSEQRSQLVTALQKKHPNQTVDVKEVVDPKILGGVRVTIDSREFDSTFSAKFDQIKTHLVSTLN